MQINEIVEFINFISSKEMNGFIPPDKICDALYSASLERFNNRLPFYAIDQKAQDDLAPFKKEYTFTNGSTPQGIITFPSDYIHLLAFDRIVYDNTREVADPWGIPIVNDDEKARRLRSQLDPVTESKPIGVWLGKGRIQLYPKKPSVGQATYLKKPNEPVFAFTQVGREITYDAANSVQMEWDDLNIHPVINRALTVLGIPLDYDKLIQYSTMQKQTETA